MACVEYSRDCGDEPGFQAMSAFGGKADIGWATLDVCF
jgi:hypothetical protein